MYKWWQQLRDSETGQATAEYALLLGLVAAGLLLALLLLGNQLRGSFGRTGSAIQAVADSTDSPGLRGGAAARRVCAEGWSGAGCRR